MFARARSYNALTMPPDLSEPKQTEQPIKIH